MTMRHRLIALFVAVVFILGTVYVPETAFAQMQEEVPVAEAPGETRVISEEVSSEEAAAEAEDPASEAAASGESEEEQEEIQLMPIKGQKQEDLLKPIGGNTPVEDDLVQEASGDEVFHPQLGVKTLLDGGRRRTKNLYGVFKRTVPAGQVRQ